MSENCLMCLRRHCRPSRALSNNLLPLQEWPNHLLGCGNKQEHTVVSPTRNGQRYSGRLALLNIVERGVLLAPSHSKKSIILCKVSLTFSLYIRGCLIVRSAQSTIPQRPYSAMDYAYHPPDEDEGDQTVVASSPARSKSPLGPRSYSPAPSPTQQPRSPLGPRPLSSLASEANRPDPRPLPSPIPRPGSSCAPKRRLDTDSEEDAVRPKKPTLPSSLGSVRQSQLPKPRIPSGQRASGSRRTSADSSRRRVPPSVAVRAPEAEESSIVVHERPARKKYISGSFHSLHKLSTDNFDDADEDQAEELLDVRGMSKCLQARVRC